MTPLTIALAAAALVLLGLGAAAWFGFFDGGPGDDGFDDEDL